MARPLDVLPGRKSCDALGRSHQFEKLRDKDGLPSVIVYVGPKCVEGPTATGREDRVVADWVSLAIGASPRTYFVTPSTPGRWRWLGFVPIGALFIVSGMWAWQHMEGGLVERTRVHLACEGIDSAGLAIDVNYRTVQLRGELPAGVSAADVALIVGEGSTDRDCLGAHGIDPASDSGVYGVQVRTGLNRAPLPR